MSSKKGKFSRDFAFYVGEIVRRKIKPLTQTVYFAGSYRRGSPDCGDIDIVILPKPGISREQIESEVATLCYEGKLGHNGGLTVGFVDPKLIGHKDGNEDASEVPDFNLFFTTESEWGAMMMYATGPANYNIACRAIAKKRGLLLNHHGVFDLETYKPNEPNEPIPNSSYGEHAVCHTIGIPWLEPRERSKGRVFPQ